MDLEILEIASNTENNKVVINHTHSSRHKNAMCGDIMQVSLIIKKNIVREFGYQCKSCVYCQAAVSLLSRNAINKSTESLKNLIKITENFFEKENFTFPKEWSVFKKLFKKKNIVRKECLKLPFKTLSKALKK